MTALLPPLHRHVHLTRNHHRKGRVELVVPTALLEASVVEQLCMMLRRRHHLRLARSLGYPETGV